MQYDQDYLFSMSESRALDHMDETPLCGIASTRKRPLATVRKTVGDVLESISYGMAQVFLRLNACASDKDSANYWMRVSAGVALWALG